MGYNRSGTIRKARLKRRKKEMERLAAKASRSTPTKGGGTKPAASPESAQ